MTRIALFLALTLLTSDALAKPGWVCDSRGCRPEPKAVAAAPTVKQNLRVATTFRTRLKARLQRFACRFGGCR